MLPDKFYDHLLLGGLESITIDGYKKALNRFLKTIGSEKPKREQAENYLLEMRKKDYSYSHIRNTSKAIMDYMKFIGRPIKFVRPRKPQELPTKDILTEGEVARMLAACKNSREAAMLALLVYCGLRNK